MMIVTAIPKSSTAADIKPKIKSKHEKSIIAVDNLPKNNPGSGIHMA